MLWHFTPSLNLYLFSVSFTVAYMHIEVYITSLVKVASSYFSVSQDLLHDPWKCCGWVGDKWGQWCRFHMARDVTWLHVYM